MDSGFRKFVIITFTLVAFMTAFMGSAINVALPTIGNEFGSGAYLQSWFATAYLMTTAVLLIPIGKLSDIFGRTIIFKTGLVIFSIFSLVCGISNNATVFLISRLLQGIGSAMLFTTMMAILVTVFPQSERGKMIGINTAGVYIGLSSGPFLGGIIAHQLGWRYIFYINFILGVVLTIPTLKYLKWEWHRPDGIKYDLTGAFVYVISLTFLMLGFTFLPAVSGIALLLSSFVTFFIFYKIEIKKKYPVFDLKIFGLNKTFTFSNLSALINYSATFALSFLLSQYLQVVRNLSPQEAGFILITQPFMMAIFSPIAGKYSDRIEPQKLSSTGMALLTAGLFVFCFISQDFSIPLIIANLAVIGIGFALFSSPNANAIMSSIEKQYYGIASSTLASMRMVGQMFSMAIVILIISNKIGTASVTPENLPHFINGLRLAFIVFSVLCFIGIFFSLLRGTIHHDKESKI